MTDTPQTPPRSRWLTALSVLLSLAMAVVVVRELMVLDWHQIAALFPTSLAFWLPFAGYYFAGPLGDWFAFRQVWPMNAGGFVALVRKQVYNEIVLGYLGEAWFYTWARRMAHGEPFGAIKDVAILSAMAGNVFTLILLAALWPQIGRVVLEGGSSQLLWAGLVVIGPMLIVLVLQKRVFSLDVRQRWAIFVIHLLRCATNTGLSAVMWHMIIPDVAVVWWLYLGTLRQLISRLPMVVNKDLLFAGLAVLLLGNRPEIATTMALTAALLVLAHISGAMLFLAGDARRWWRTRQAKRAAILPEA